MNTFQLWCAMGAVCVMVAGMLTGNQAAVALAALVMVALLVQLLIDERIASEDNQQPRRSTITCPACRGLGKDAISTLPCPRCHGTGRIPRD